MGDVAALLGPLVGETYNWFDAITDEDRAAVEELFVTRTYAAGDYVFREGDPASGIYVVVRGLVAIGSFGTEEREILLFVVDADGNFGAVSALDGRAQGLDARAIGSVTVRQLQQHNVAQLVARRPALAQALTTQVCHDFRFIYGVMRNHALGALDTRLARVLLSASAIYGRHVKDTIVIDAFRQEFAARHLGVARQSVARILFEWRERGIVATGYRRLIVLDVAALSAIAFRPARDSTI